MKRILIIEDDRTFSNILCKFLKKNSFEVTPRTKVSEGIAEISTGKYDLMLIDYRLPDGTAIDLLGCYEFQNAKLPAIVMTTFNDVRTAVKMMRMGALDYIIKPVNPDELLMSINTIIAPETRKKDDQPNAKPNWIKGKSEVSKHLHDHMELVASTDMAVLIKGESGTGKEYVARNIHRLSARANEPFVAVDCGALSPELAASELFGHTKGAFTSAVQNKKGHFEMANGGTLFMDEIGNLSYGNQVKLLRALQEKTIQPIGSEHTKEVDLRIITATNEDLYDLVQVGKFRQDLYHRINEFEMAVPPLRNRGTDLELFIDHFIKEANASLDKQVLGFSSEVMKIFHEYSWPGNLRELKNVVKRSVLLTKDDFAGKETLPDEMFQLLNEQDENYLNNSTTTTSTANHTDLKAVQESNEKMMIIKTLQRVQHNKTKAARLLNIDRKTLYNKLSRYNIE